MHRACHPPPSPRPVVWVNGVIQALPEGETDWRELDRDLGAAVAHEHQFLQVRRRRARPSHLTRG
jgi:hypothetical protein